MNGQRFETLLTVQKRLGRRFIVASMLLLAVALFKQNAVAQFGSCSGCSVEWYWNEELGRMCQRYYCTDPRFPNCLGQQPGAPVCNPGDQAITTACSAIGVDRCSYQCNASGTGWESPTCTQIGNNGNFYREFCNWNAGCDRGPSGEVNGRLTRVGLLCTQNGTATQTLSEQACGSCQRQPTCLPGQPCEQPTGCSQVPRPNCIVGAGGATCTFDSLTVDARPQCLTVQRNPFPRGLVGVPNTLCAQQPQTVSQTGSEDFLNAPRYGDVVGLSARLEWIPSPDEPVWTMDERSWNVGQTSDDVRSPITGQPVSSEMGGNMSIQDTRVGMCVSHIYETSSYDMPANGPSGDPLVRFPAYQVQVTQEWSFRASFECRYRAREPYCTWAGTETPTDCPDHKPQGTECTTNPNYKGCLVDWRERDVINSQPAPGFAEDGILVAGGTVPQDPSGPTCGIVAIPILQSQSVLRP